MHVYQAKEWQDIAGDWSVADTNDLGNNSAVWWIPPQIFGLSYEDYINMLVKRYHVTTLTYNYEKNVLLFSWTNYADAHRYLLDINRIARRRNFKIC